MVRLNPSTFWHLLTILKIKKQNVPHEINRVCTQRPHTNICVSSSCCAAAQIYTHEHTQWHNDRKANTWASARDGPRSLTRAQRRRPNRGRNDGQTNRRTNKQTYTDTNRHTQTQTDRHTHKHTDIHTDRHSDRRTDRYLFGCFSVRGADGFVVCLTFVRHCKFSSLLFCCFSISCAVSSTKRHQNQ